VRLTWLGARLAVCRLSATAALPDWAARRGELFCAVRTADELSIVCDERNVPDGVRREGPFGALKVSGPLPFAQVGVLSSLLAPIAEAAVSVLAVSTFETDYLLVPQASRDRAAAALTAAGHEIG